MEGDQNSKNASNEDYMGAWGDEIPDFLQSSAPAPSEQPTPVKKGKQKGKGKKNKQKLKKAPVPKPIVEETKQVNEIPQASTTMEPDFEAPAPQETIQKVQQKQKPMQPEPSSTAEVAKEETNVEGKELNMEENKQNIPIENQSPAENAPEESPEGATQEAPEEDKKEETEEERKKREEKEKRAKNIEILEKQIQEEESMMFDWGNLEETMEKQKFIDSLKEELYYLKNPNKKRKKKKKAPKNNKKLMVNILKPQMSKNTIVKEQLMTEKSVKLCNDPDFEVSNIKLDKLQKGMFNRSNNCFMNVILQSLYSIPVFYNFLAHLNDQIESNPLMKDIFDRNSDDNLLIANFLELAKCFSPDTGGITNMLHYGDKVINVEEIFKTLLMNFNPDKQQQDCHEFLGLMLDTLNNELNEILEKVGISTKSQSLKDTSVGPAAEEWEETGKKKLKIKNKAEDLIKNSPIFEIFGG